MMSRSALVRLAGLALCTLLGACDMPTDPVATNPYDPEFPGRRIVSSPDSVRLGESTSTSVTLSWTDRSTFETGFRVERAFGTLSSTGVGSYVTVATLPADASTYTDASLTDTTPRLYRVTALANGVEDTEGPSSAPLRVEYPLENVRLSALETLAPAVADGTFTPDGRMLYATTGRDIWRVDTQTGSVEGRLVGGRHVAGLLDDGRVVVEQAGDAQATSIDVRTYSGQTVDRQVELRASGDADCPALYSTTVRVSGTGAVYVGVCTSGGLAVWGSGGGAPSRTFPAQAPILLRSVEVSRDGARAAAINGGRELVVYNLATGVQAWSRNDSGAHPALFNPDGTRILDGTNGQARLLDAATGDVRATAASNGGAEPLAFSPDGQRLAYFAGFTTNSNVAIAGGGDLAPVFQLNRTLVRAFQVLNGGNGIGLRISEGPRFDLYRWDLSRRWEAVPIAPTQPA